MGWERAGPGWGTITRVTAGLEQLSRVVSPAGWSTRPVDLTAVAHDASHYLLTPAALVTPAAWAWVGWAILMGIILGAHILRGWQLGPLGPRALLDLARAPFFVLWKLHALLRRRGEQGWVKTRRDGQ